MVHTFIIPNIWFSETIQYFFLMTMAFICYVLPFGQKNLWARLFTLHFQFPFALCGLLCFICFIFIFIFKKTNHLRVSTNYKIVFPNYLT